MKYDYLEDKFVIEPDIDFDFANKLINSKEPIKVLLELLSILGYEKTVEAAKHYVK